MINSQKPHFTELSCILETLAISLRNVSATFQAPNTNREQDIFHSRLKSINPAFHKNYILKAIQIQFIISFTLIEECEEGDNVMETFWIDYRNYLGKKF